MDHREAQRPLLAGHEGGSLEDHHHGSAGGGSLLGPGSGPRGWLADQLRNSGTAVLRESPSDLGGRAAASMVPPGYQQPKMSARGAASRATAAASSRAR
jgi:hypothetical protein